MLKYISLSYTLMFKLERTRKCTFVIVLEEFSINCRGIELPMRGRDPGHPEPRGWRPLKNI